MHTVAIMKADENYNNLVQSLAHVFDEINELVKNPTITIDHQQYKVILYLCCDYKVSLKQNNEKQCVKVILYRCSCKYWDYIQPMPPTHVYDATFQYPKGDDYTCSCILLHNNYPCILQK